MQVIIILLLVFLCFLIYKLLNIKVKISILETENKNLLEIKNENIKQIDELNKNINILKESVIEYKKIEVKLETEKQSLEKMKEEQKTQFENIQKLAKGEFKELADIFLKENKNELQKSTLETLNPLKDNINEFKKQIIAFDKETSERHNNLNNEIKNIKTLNTSLQEEASNLTKALSKNKVQGNFGEILLERVLEWGGLTESRDFERQKSYKNKKGDTKIVDILLNMPKDKKLIIDAKMSLENYKNYVATDDPVEKQKELDKHISSIKKHIDELADSGYTELLENSLDLLIMFIPIEYSYFVALEKDTTLNEYASKKNVVLATASSLFAIVTSVQHFWKTQKQLNKIKEILTIGQNLYERINSFTESMEQLEASIEKSKQQFEKSRAKIFGAQGLIVSARKLVECGISKSAKKAIDLLELEDTEQIENNVIQKI